MNNHYFIVERPGIHTTFQDSGYENLQHFGITTGGVIDNNLFKIANKLLGNNLNETIIEFAYQGPRLRLNKGCVQIVITGDVHFIISKKSENFFENIGETFRTYQLNEGDIIDILATKNSVYGYFGVIGGFKIIEPVGASKTARSPSSSKVKVLAEVWAFVTAVTRILQSVAAETLVVPLFDILLAKYCAGIFYFPFLFTFFLVTGTFTRGISTVATFTYLVT